jgi:hypothetical protein
MKFLKPAAIFRNLEIYYKKCKVYRLSGAFTDVFQLTNTPAARTHTLFTKVNKLPADCMILSETVTHARCICMLFIYIHIL